MAPNHPLIRTLIHLLIVVCYKQNADHAIVLAGAIPYPCLRDLAMNHLIFRFTHPERYKAIWRVFIETLMPREPLDVLLEKLSIAHEQGFRPTSSIDSLPLAQDIEKAIVLFKRFPVMNRGKLINTHLMLRSAYIIDALLKKGNREKAREFLPFFRHNVDFSNLRGLGMHIPPMKEFTNPKIIFAFEKSYR